MRYLILGVTEARDETGAPSPIGGARLRALLAALALRAGRRASVADLVDDVGRASGATIRPRTRPRPSKPSSPGCAERFLPGMAEAAAVLLADDGRPAEAVRACAAATAWRAGHPRSVSERGAVDGLPERTRALLGPARYAREESAGAALTPSELAAALTATLTGS